MSCMCGDTNCSSCGPAQGYDPVMERIMEVMSFLAKADGPEEQEVIDRLIESLGRFHRIADLLQLLCEQINISEEKELSDEEISTINSRLDGWKPCEKHDIWPDPHYGCIDCYDESLED